MEKHNAKMATSQSQGETSMEIATATNKDSSQMLSIAVATMIFLLGTFFAVSILSFQVAFSNISHI
jgi:uncharacterized membrane protein